MSVDPIGTKVTREDGVVMELVAYTDEWYPKYEPWIPPGETLKVGDRVIVSGRTVEIIGYTENGQAKIRPVAKDMLRPSHLPNRAQRRAMAARERKARR